MKASTAPTDLKAPKPLDVPTPARTTAQETSR
jgi:hypothetical protein